MTIRITITKGKQTIGPEVFDDIKVAIDYLEAYRDEEDSNNQGN
jgi:hypothetical protein